ncbi:MAG: hypothetical protein J6331_00535, partial [Lentisphaeria bacterium]|nr:hypothetical protein [Lentisphaeria bacterium]
LFRHISIHGSIQAHYDKFRCFHEISSFPFGLPPLQYHFPECFQEENGVFRGLKLKNGSFGGMLHSRLYEQHGRNHEFLRKKS